MALDVFGAEETATQKVNRHSRETHKKIQLQNKKFELEALKANDPFLPKTQIHLPNARVNGILFEKEETVYNKEPAFNEKASPPAAPNAVEIVENKVEATRRKNEVRKYQLNQAYEEMNRRAAASGYQLTWDEQKMNVIAVTKSSAP